MTLREIAERWKKHEDYCQDNPAHTHMECRPQHQEDIASLLNAVVEERAKYLMLYHRHIYKGVDHFGVKHFFDKALRELDLKGVWPVKEKG